MTSIPYSVERTRNRSSRAVIRGDAVLIRLARGLSTMQEQEHIETLLRRMSKAFAREQSRIPIDPFRPLLNGESPALPPIPALPSLPCPPESWLIMHSEKTDPRTLHRSLWRSYSESALPAIDALVRSINKETLNVRIRDVRLKLMRSRWGSCSHTGTITLSTPLLFTSPEILRYVIIHELAHLIHPNHSAKFWRTVEAHVPQYRELIRELRNRKLPIL